MTMKTVVNVSCDGENCDHVRANDSNHWLVGTYQTRKGKCVTLATNREVLKGKGFIEESVKDFCGEQCAIKWVSKQLAEIKK